VTCLITANVAGACACGKPMEPAHIREGERPTCADCCPAHEVLSHDWESAAAPTGEQSSLFETGSEEYPE